MRSTAIRITIITCCLALLVSCAGLRKLTGRDEDRSLLADTAPPPPVAKPPSTLAQASPPAAAEDAFESPDPWTRLHNGFRLSGPEQHAPIEREVAWYLQNPRYLETVFARASRFLPDILTAIENRNLPTELALLPIIESAYRPRAHSHRNAMGLWQFIPATGRRYDLRQTPWTDDRGNVARSTVAALTHLQRLADNFDGDWLLALAAYNCGARKVRLAVRADLARGGTGEFWSLELPRITRRYVPKLLALARIIAEADQGSYRLPELNEPEELAAVSVPRPLSLDVAAELADMTPHALWDFNAELRRPVTPPGGYTLQVPVGRADALRVGLRALPEDEWMRWTEHVVQSGESLWLIARRYGVTVASLKQVNGLGSNLIKPGKSLLLPPGANVISSDGTGEI